MIGKIATILVLAAGLFAVRSETDPEIVHPPDGTVFVDVDLHCEGHCEDFDEDGCDRLYSRWPCHGWEWGFPLSHSIGTDSHIENRDVEMMGEGSCSEHHSTDGCEGGGTAFTQLEFGEIFRAVRDSNADRVVQIVSDRDGAWVEFNGDRDAIQILATPCDGSPGERVIGHIPVQDAAFWARAIATD